MAYNQIKMIFICGYIGNKILIKNLKTELERAEIATFLQLYQKQRESTTL